MIMNLFFSFTVYSAWDWDFVLLWVVGEKGVFLFFFLTMFFPFCLFQFLSRAVCISYHTT